MSTHNRMPLRWRVVLITVLLLALGLTASGVAVISLLRVTLMNQIDAQLTTAIRTTDLGQLLTFTVPKGLTPYAYFVHLGTGNPTVHIPPQYSIGPDFAPCQAASGDNATVTTKGADGAKWRCMRAPITDKHTGEILGEGIVAIPLEGVEHTVAGMGRWVLMLGTGLLLVGGSAAYWASRRALRPLRDIELTAANIARGDLTERVAAGPVTTEVGSLGASLNTMLGQIESSFEARKKSEERMRQFVADASHELRTPLAAMRGYGELYRMGAITTKEATDDTMARIESSATRMGSLVEDLLNLARLDEAQPLRLTEVDLVALVRDSAADAMAIDPQRQVAVVGLDSPAPAPLTVPADAGKLRQVILNLVSNVLSHTPATASLTLAVGTQDGNAVVEVRDTGPGISAEHLDRVFERFYRVEKSRTRERGGAGLGMSIVQAIMTAHNGSVELHSQPGQGTTVRIILPGVGPHPRHE